MASKKVFQLYKEGEKCGSCNWETDAFYALGDSKEDAEASDGAQCAGCFAETLVTDDAKVEVG